MSLLPIEDAPSSGGSGGGEGGGIRRELAIYINITRGSLGSGNCFIEAPFSAISICRLFPYVCGVGVDYDEIPAFLAGITDAPSTLVQQRKIQCFGRNE